MPGEPCDSVKACAERVQRAAETLHPERPSSLKVRLQAAAETIGVLDPRDFPSDLRVSFARIHEAITAEGSFTNSVERMSAERARAVSEDILTLAAEVSRREDAEHAD